MAFEFVRDVNEKADKKEYMEEKARRERRIAMLRPPTVKSLGDFERVIASLKKFDQRPELIECEERECTVFGVNEIAVNREEEKATLEVNHEDYERKFFLELENVFDVDVREPTSTTDVIYERRHGGERPLKRFPDYITAIYSDRGKCFVHWESRGPYRKESPYHKQGFEVYCTEMTVEELLEKFRDKLMESARWRLKKMPGEKITEEELRKVAEGIIADRKRCKTI